MSYKEERQQEFYHFSDTEAKIIYKFLKERGYKIDTNTVCGDCCGMYADYIYINGTGGGWKSKKDCDDFKKLCEKNKIECSFNEYKKDTYHYTISADPDEYNIKIK